MITLNVCNHVSVLFPSDSHYDHRGEHCHHQAFTAYAFASLDYTVQSVWSVPVVLPLRCSLALTFCYGSLCTYAIMTMLALLKQVLSGRYNNNGGTLADVAAVHPLATRPAFDLSVPTLASLLIVLLPFYRSNRQIKDSCYYGCTNDEMFPYGRFSYSLRDSLVRYV